MMARRLLTVPLLLALGLALPARAVDLNVIIDAVKQAFFSSDIKDEQEIGYAAASTLLGARTKTLRSGYADPDGAWRWNLTARGGYQPWRRGTTR